MVGGGGAVGAEGGTLTVGGLAVLGAAPEPAWVRPPTTWLSTPLIAPGMTVHRTADVGRDPCHTGLLGEHKQADSRDDAADDREGGVAAPSGEYRAESGDDTEHDDPDRDPSGRRLERRACQ